jgi:L-threonylcarbamoyladenylate synthase
VQTEVFDALGPERQASAIARATALLRAGEVVALPTETVYGLAGDALNPDAVLKIFEAKARPSFDPLIVHLPTQDWLERVANVGNELRDLVSRLAERFWPGPLTLVLPRAAIASDLVTAGLDSVAVRVSAHPIFSEVLREFGKPLAAPSANRFGRISPTAAAHVLDELGGRIPLIIDGGRTTHGIESTVVAIRGATIQVLRPGPITIAELGEIGAVAPCEAPTRITSPGQLPSHYAPRTPLVLIDDLSSFQLPTNSRGGLLAFSGDIDVSAFAEVRHLTRSRDLREAAANLFRCLRELDQSGVDLIVAESVPEERLGSAIMDRLRRASAAR